MTWFRCCMILIDIVSWDSDTCSSQLISRNSSNHPAAAWDLNIFSSCCKELVCCFISPCTALSAAFKSCWRTVELKRSCDSGPSPLWLGKCGFNVSGHNHLPLPYPLWPIETHPAFHPKIGKLPEIDVLPEGPDAIRELRWTTMAFFWSVPFYARFLSWFTRPPHATFATLPVPTWRPTRRCRASRRWPGEDKNNDIIIRRRFLMLSSNLFLCCWLLRFKMIYCKTFRSFNTCSMVVFPLLDLEFSPTSARAKATSVVQKDKAACFCAASNKIALNPSTTNNEHHWVSVGIKHCAISRFGFHKNSGWPPKLIYKCCLLTTAGWEWMGFLVTSEMQFSFHLKDQLGLTHLHRSQETWFSNSKASAWRWSSANAWRRALASHFSKIV